MEVPDEMDEECRIFEEHDEEANQYDQEEIRSDTESYLQCDDDFDGASFWHLSAILENKHSNVSSEEEDEIPGLTSAENSSSEEESSGKDREFVRAQRVKKF